MFLEQLLLYNVKEGTLMARKGKIIIDREVCKGCYLCMGVCPKSVLKMSDRIKSTVDKEDDCIGCRLCENICPDLAITITERV